MSIIFESDDVEARVAKYLFKGARNIAAKWAKCRLMNLPHSRAVKCKYQMKYLIPKAQRPA